MRNCVGRVSKQMSCGSTSVAVSGPSSPDRFLLRGCRVERGEHGEAVCRMRMYST